MVSVSFPGQSENQDESEATVKESKNVSSVFAGKYRKEYCWTQKFHLYIYSLENLMYMCTRGYINMAIGSLFFIVPNW